MSELPLAAWQQRIAKPPTPARKLSLSATTSAPYHAGMNRIHTILASALLIATAILCAAEEPAPSFVVVTTNGAPLRGQLQELKPDWSFRVGDKMLGGQEVVNLRRVDVQLPPLPTEKHLILANGDRIPMDAPRLVGEKLHFVHPDLGDGKDVSVPLSAVAVLWFTTPDNVEYPDLLRRQLTNATRSRDRVLLRNGDALEGLLNALDGKRVEVEVNRKPITVSLDKVSAIALSTDGLDKMKPKGVYARVVLTGGDGTNGTRLSLSSATCDGVILQGTTVFGANLRVPLDRIASLDLMQGAAVYLSEIKPAKFEQTSYLGDGVKWPLVADAAVTGRDLRLHGSVYDKGLGMHSRSRVTYVLDGKYRRFDAIVGLDDETGREGSARVRVFGDGKALDLGKDGDLTAKNGPLLVSVPVTGVKELTLETDFGRRGDVQGHVDWADARLIK